MDARAGPLPARRSPLRFCARMLYALEVNPWSIPQPGLSCGGRRRMLGRLRCPSGYAVIRLISVASAVSMNQSALRLPFSLTVKHVVRDGPRWTGVYHVRRNPCWPPAQHSTPRSQVCAFLVLFSDRARTRCQRVCLRTVSSHLVRAALSSHLGQQNMVY